MHDPSNGRRAASAACAFAVFLMTAMAAGTQAAAQSTTGIPPEAAGRSRTLIQAREAYRERINENVLFLMGGQLGAVYVAIAQDIAVVVDDGTNLRVLPVVSAGGVQNVHDLVFLRGVDLALTNVQTLDHMKASGELGPNLDRQISYIAPLFPEEMQVLARGTFQTLEDLRGKRVSYNARGSANALLAPKIMQALGIETVPFFMSQPDAIQKMRAGELDATICMCPSPVPAFQAVKADWGLRLIEVPFAAPVQTTYLPASMSADLYPELIAKGTKLETIASSTVLISFNWPRGSARYLRTAKFVDYFFSRFGDLLKPPRHPLWRTVNFAANIPGWQRFPAAQEWLDKSRTQQTEQTEAAFREFLRQRADRGGAAVEGEEKERVFREFLESLQAARR